MKFIFLGYTVPAELIDDCGIGISVAGNKMQIDLLEAIWKTGQDECKPITIYPIAAYPNDRRICVRKERIKLINNHMALKVSFINLPIIKQISQILSVYGESKKMIDKDTVLITYNMYPQVGIPAIWLKRKYGCKIYSLLADLPIDDRPNVRCRWNRILKCYFDHITKKAIRKCDGVVVLNKEAARLFAPHIPYIVVEGGVREKRIYKSEINTVKKKNLLYTGALVDYSGVMALIKAMDWVKDDDVTLDIYGSGYLEEDVKNACMKNSKIHFHGLVSNEEIIRIQREAYILVNPRPMSDPIARVTFPSKILEYMTNDRPVISTMLNGFTRDFLENLYIAKEGVEGLVNTIDYVTSLDEEELQAKADNAYKFVMTKMTWDKQWKKIREFIEYHENKV